MLQNFCFAVQKCIMAYFTFATCVLQEHVVGGVLFFCIFLQLVLPPKYLIFYRLSTKYFGTVIVGRF